MSRAVSLNEQIAEVTRELAYREQAYPRLAGGGKLRESEADYFVERLRAVRKTLVWLQRNQRLIKHRLGGDACVSG